MFRRIDAFRAAISALRVEVVVFARRAGGRVGDDDGGLEGDSGSLSGSWVVGSWKEGLRRWVVGESDVGFTGEGDLRWRWEVDAVLGFGGKGCCSSAFLSSVCGGRTAGARAADEVPFVPPQS